MEFETTQNINETHQSQSIPSTSSPNVDYLTSDHPNSLPTLNHIIHEENVHGRNDEEYENDERNRNNHSYRPNPLVAGNKVCGTGFNTMPIYDPQDSLVGLQASAERNLLEDFDNERKNEILGYNGNLHSDFHHHYPHYNLTLQQNANMIPSDYNIPYAACTFNPQNRHILTPLPCQQQQYYQQNYHFLHNHQQSQHHQPQNHQQTHYIHHYQPQAGKTLLVRSASGIIGVDQNNYNNPDIFKPLAHETFDKCPIVCSLFAIFCCPITIWCSLPALVYSLCAYTDYRTSNINQYRRKSDIARHLVIIACIVGLLLCITWAILTFFYYEFMLSVFNDIIHIISQRIRSGT
ncbi:hypothetical protein EWB00_004521 [Schistosoma japonicum]|uniref:Uncharacterized protein n=1 Tax=Schistosoma japonicum TaxID=6182 RepID=A0A4Z2DVD2_SCHJA|nr:hypothetical protein EWB00_004521 [Schistosoma japonicum]